MKCVQQAVGCDDLSEGGVGAEGEVERVSEICVQVARERTFGIAAETARG